MKVRSFTCTECQDHYWAAKTIPVAPTVARSAAGAAAPMASRFESTGHRDSFQTEKRPNRASPPPSWLATLWGLDRGIGEHQAGCGDDQ